jgi:ribonuclease HI
MLFYQPLHVASTDGAASGNPGPAGWAFDLDGGIQSGRFECATNNEMELLAIFLAIQECPPNSNLIVRTDSKLAIMLISRRYKARTNMELAKLVNLIHDILWLRKIDLTLMKVKGHADDPGNNGVDRAAYHQAQSMKRKLAIQRSRRK